MCRGDTLCVGNGVTHELCVITKVSNDGVLLDELQVLVERKRRELKDKHREKNIREQG